MSQTIHRIYTAPTALKERGPYEAHCDCGWQSSRAYGFRREAYREGREHLEAQGVLSG